MLLDDLNLIFRKCSNNIFYSDEKCEIRYKDLNEYVSKLYTYLIKLKNKENNRIIVYGHKDIRMIISFIACSYAGITYVPVDYNLGLKRLVEIIDITNPLAIIDTENALLGQDFKNIISREKISSICKEEKKTQKLVPIMEKEDIYYIIFTSGSTGVPKGVQVTYNNLDCFVKWIRNTINISNSKILNQALYSFDLSVADIYLALLSGSEHIPIVDSSVSNYNNMLSCILKKNPDVIVCTSTFLEFLLLDSNFCDVMFNNLQYIFLCGEILKSQTLKNVLNRFNKAKVINAYGPTECTVAITSVELNNYFESEIPIGKVEDNNFDVVSENLDKKNDSELGEIIIYGDFVSNGYINSNDEQKKFVTYKNKKAYLTGDIGYTKNGYLYFKCRKDRQIKYKGYRIELDDIEKNICNIDTVEKCAVVSRKNNEKVVNLTAYVVLKEDDIRLKQKVSEILPKYMIPNIKIVEDLPINNNFKLDRKKIEEKENER